MLSFNIAHMDLLHEMLKQIADDYRERGSLGVVERDNEGAKHLHFPRDIFQANAIDLHPPLMNISFAVRARGNYYIALIPVIACGAAHLERLSERFEETFFSEKQKEAVEEDRLSWLSVNTTGVGRIYRAGIPILNIGRFSTGANQLDNGRIIAIGDFGVESRKIEKEIDTFYVWMDLMQKVATAYVHSAYDIHNARQLIEKEGVLSLDCVI